MKQKIFGIPLLNSSTECRKTQILLWICVILTLGFLLIVQPVLSRFFITTTDIHQGTHYYDDLSYMKFESGDVFSQLVNQLEFDTLGQVMDFYHVDNHVRDNPVYGKHCDVFALDIQMDHGMYLNYQDSISSKWQHCGSIETFELYLVYAFDSTTKEQGEVVLIALCEENKVARLILLTDKDPVALPSGYISTLFQNTSLNWS